MLLNPTGATLERFKSFDTAPNDVSKVFTVLEHAVASCLRE